MEIKSTSDMAKAIAGLINGTDDDDLWNYAANWSVFPQVNNIAIKDDNTGKSYIINIKEVK